MDIFDDIIRTMSKENSSGSFVAKSTTEYAIVGLSFRLPYAQTLDDLDCLLEKSWDAVHYPSEKRQELAQTLIDAPDDSYTYLQAAYLENIDSFDYGFFHISKGEAELMDPTHRLFLQAGWLAFEDAGYTTDKLKGSRTGIYVSLPQATKYRDGLQRNQIKNELMAAPGNISSFIGSRLSHLLDLHGPSLTIDTACSSALVALNEACLHLNQGNCDLALVGGVNLLLPAIHYNGTLFPEIQSSTGRALTLDNSANGTSLGEGVIAIVLKTLEKAEQNNDRIYGVIRGISVNHDGKSLGITAPNRESQTQCICQAWDQAGINPTDIDYVEMHGTGTNLGDPIELFALKDAFERYTSKKQFCAIGSIKTNFGHTDSIAGLIGLLKCLVILYKRKVYPHPHITLPNLKFDFFNSPFYIPDTNTNANVQLHEKPICTVSAFGLSGTNSHLVVQAYTPLQTEETPPPPHTLYQFPLSGHNQSSLIRYANQLRHFLSAEKTVNFENLCYTAWHCKNHYKKRAIIVFQSMDELISSLEQLEQSGKQALYTPTEVITTSTNKGTIGSPNYDLAFKYINNENVELPANIPGHLCKFPERDFDYLSVWFSSHNAGHVNNKARMVLMETNRQDQEIYQIKSELHNLIQEIFLFEDDSLNDDLDFISIGFDSISIMQLRNAILDKYALALTPDELLNKINTVSLLCRHIIRNRPLAKGNTNTDVAPFSPFPQENPPTSAKMDSIRDIVQQQLSIMEQQLELLGLPASKNIPPPQEPFTKIAIAGNHTTVNQQRKSLSINLNQPQTEFLKEIIGRYNNKFPNTKQFIQEARKTWANGRFIKDYHPLWKDTVLPIIASSASGSTVTDIDGNHFVDFSMGFGALIFGFNRPEISSALQEATLNQMILGPITGHAAKVSRLIKQITGMDRVCFCNSGTEAVMNVLRLARAVTSKTKVVQFAGSYHGTFDPVYVMNDGNNTVRPFSPGTPDSILHETIVLPYGEESSLQYIQANCHKIAAVLVEPVQSRNPDLQPRIFLQHLREITNELEIALIFDEVINGFRLALGGAQEYYGIHADLAVYGKIVGGGMPIGIIAGSQKYMNAIDGGAWNYADETQPEPLRIQTGGTFWHHPVTMHVAERTLDLLLIFGKQLQKELNQRAQIVVDFLNDFFTQNRIPITLMRGGSQFIFKSNNPILLRYLYHLLLLNGIYVWEGGTCYISTAHTDDELMTFVYQVIKQCLYIHKMNVFYYPELQNYAIDKFPNQELKDALASSRNAISLFDTETCTTILNTIDMETVECVIPLGNIHRQILSFNILNRSNGGDISYTLGTICGDLDINRLKAAIDSLVFRHPILRSSILWKKLPCPLLIIHTNQSADFQYHDITSHPSDVGIFINEKIQETCKKGFARTQSRIRFILIRTDTDRYRLVILYENSLFDGWSLNILLADLFNAYRILQQDYTAQFEVCDHIIPYLWHQYQSRNKDATFWVNLFQEFVLDGPILHSQSQLLNRPIFIGKMHIAELNTLLTQKLIRAAKLNQVTLYSLLVTAWAITWSQIEGTNKVIVGTAVNNRLAPNANLQSDVGMFTNILPLPVNLESKPLDDVCRHLYETTRKMIEYGNTSIYDVIQHAKLSETHIMHTLYHKTMVFINYPANEPSSNSISVQLDCDNSFTNVPLRVYVEQNENIRITFRFNELDYDEKAIDEMASLLIDNIQSLADMQGTL